MHIAYEISKVFTDSLFLLFVGDSTSLKAIPITTISGIAMGFFIF